MRLGNWRAMFVEGFEVEDDSFADQFFHFGSCVCDGDTTGQIRYVGGVAIVGSFNEDSVWSRFAAWESGYPGRHADWKPHSSRRREMRATVA